MRVCVVRNAEAESNANMIRVIDALMYGGFEVIILSRNREKHDGENTVLKKHFNINGEIIENYEIQLQSDRGNGIANIFNLLKYLMIVFTWLKRNEFKYEYIHSFDLDTGVPSVLASKVYDKYFIYHIADFYVDSRGGIPDIFKNFIRDLEFKIINNADLTVICTEERKEQIWGSSPKRLVVIHNTPVNLEYGQQITNDIYHTRDNKLRISYVGGLTEPRFIKEILDIVSIDTRLHLDIAGYGTLTDIVKEYDRKYYNINFKGKIDYYESLEQNAKSDLMIAMYNPNYKNHKYSAPNKVYEAMLFGKPIIVAKDTGIDKLVSNENIGFVSNYEVDSFEKTINYILKNPIKVKRYSENAKKTYPNYSWSKMKMKLINEYEKL